MIGIVFFVMLAMIVLFAVKQLQYKICREGGGSHGVCIAIIAAR